MSHCYHISKTAYNPDCIFYAFVLNAAGEPTVDESAPAKIAGIADTETEKKQRRGTGVIKMCAGCKKYKAASVQLIPNCFCKAGFVPFSMV